jgi:hypothetical protein
MLSVILLSWCVWEILDKYPALVRYYSGGRVLLLRLPLIIIFCALARARGAREKAHQPSNDIIFKNSSSVEVNVKRCEILITMR